MPDPKVIEEDDDKPVEEAPETPTPQLQIEEDEADDEPEAPAGADAAASKSVNAARRARQREARERAEATIGLLREELSAANQRLDRVERRGVQNDFERIDGAIARARSVIVDARARLSEATKSGDGEMAAQAAEALSDGKIAMARFTAMRENAEHAVRTAVNSAGGARQQRQPSPEHRAMAQQAVQYGENWKRRNGWFDSPGAETDTAVVDALDSYVMEKERLDPATPEYWQRLDELVAEKLPHRTGRGSNGAAAPRARSTPPSRGSDREEGGGDGGFTLTRAEKEAAQAAGLWDTPDGRKRAVAYFRKAIKDQEARDR